MSCCPNSLYSAVSPPCPLALSDSPNSSWPFRKKCSPFPAKVLCNSLTFAQPWNLSSAYPNQSGLFNSILIAAVLLNSPFCRMPPPPICLSRNPGSKLSNPAEFKGEKAIKSSSAKWPQIKIFGCTHSPRLKYWKSKRLQLQSCLFDQIRGAYNLPRFKNNKRPCHWAKRNSKESSTSRNNLIKRQLAVFQVRNSKPTVPIFAGLKFGK